MHGLNISGRVALNVRKKWLFRNVVGCFAVDNLSAFGNFRNFARLPAWGDLRTVLQ